MRHVYTDLVGTAGLELDPHVGMRTKPLEHPIVAHGRLAAIHHRHALTLLPVAADGCINGSASGNHTHHDGLVDAADGASLELFDQLGLRLESLGHHHQAGGVLVQAMHDTGTRNVDQIGYAVQQCIEQGTVLMAGRRMHHQPRRLVQHQDLLILVDDVQIDVLRHPFALRLLFGLEHQTTAAVNGIARPQALAVDLQTAVLDPAGQARSGVLGKQLRGDLIQALSAHFIGHVCTELDGVLGDRMHAWLRRGGGFGFSRTLVVKYGVFAPAGSGAHIITGRSRPRQAAVTGTHRHASETPAVDRHPRSHRRLLLQ